MLTDACLGAAIWSLPHDEVAVLTSDPVAPGASLGSDRCETLVADATQRPSPCECGCREHGESHCPECRHVFLSPVAGDGRVLLPAPAGAPDR